MRVLPDVNVLVRAHEKSLGPARKLLLELISRKVIVLTSAQILIELGRVLRYPRVQELFGLSEEQIYEYVQFLKDVCQIVPIEMNWNFPIRDASDTAILKTAVAGEAGHTAENTAVSGSPLMAKNSSAMVQTLAGYEMRRVQKAYKPR